MAAITLNNPAINSLGVQFLEDVTITNQTAASTAVKSAFYVPKWATKLVMYIFYDSATGTTPTFAFTMGIPDFGDATTFAAPTDATDIAVTLGNAAWDGITTLTGGGPYLIVIEIGPDVTDDDTGSATASCFYGIHMELPPVLNYTYTTTDSADDADYRFRIVNHWKA